MPDSHVFYVTAAGKEELKLGLANGMLRQQETEGDLTNRVLAERVVKANSHLAVSMQRQVDNLPFCEQRTSGRMFRDGGVAYPVCSDSRSLRCPTGPLPRHRSGTVSAVHCRQHACGYLLQAMIARRNGRRTLAAAWRRADGVQGKAHCSSTSDPLRTPPPES